MILPFVEGHRKGLEDSQLGILNGMLSVDFLVQSVFCGLIHWCSFILLPNFLLLQVGPNEAKPLAHLASLKTVL
jgi:hypothetical protein